MHGFDLLIYKGIKGVLTGLSSVDLFLSRRESQLHCKILGLIRRGGILTLLSVFSFFPPSYTIRRYQRATLATTSCEIGSAYCGIISYATSKDPEEDQEIVTSLVAIRSKLNRSAVLKANAIYEVSVWHASHIIYEKTLLTHTKSVLIAGKVASKTVP